MKGQLQRIFVHTVESSQISTLEIKIKYRNIRPGSPAIFISGWDNQVLYTEIKSIDVISLEREFIHQLPPCAFLLMSAVCRSGQKLRYYKPHYQSIFKSLWRAAIYTYLECWRQLCWTLWCKINTVTMKSFLLRTLGSSCQHRSEISLFLSQSTGLRRITRRKCFWLKHTLACREEWVLGFLI